MSLRRAMWKRKRKRFKKVNRPVPYFPDGPDCPFCNPDGWRKEVGLQRVSVERAHVRTREMLEGYGDMTER